MLTYLPTSAQEPHRLTVERLQTLDYLVDSYPSHIDTDVNMKATTKVCNVRSTDLALKPDQFRIKHNKAEPTMTEAEMVACFAKLKDLVPTIPADRKISKVNLLQHVIDYILDLELTLEHHPAMSKTPPPHLLAAAGLPERKPLGESTTYNTLLQVSSHLERHAAEKCGERPASY